MIFTSLIAASCGLLTLQSAVLILVILGGLILAKMVSDLRGEVRALRDQRAQQPEPKAESVQPVSRVSVPPALPEQSLAPVLPASDEIPADIFAAIVAAVHYTLGQESHLVSVTSAETLVWSREGRRNIFNSHTFR